MSIMSSITIIIFNDYCVINITIMFHNKEKTKKYKKIKVFNEKEKMAFD